MKLYYASNTILKKLQMKSKSIHTVSFFSYWDHTSLIGQCLCIYYFSKHLYKPCKITMYIIINAACALRNTCQMPWMLFILLTGHNEDLPCQIVYNPHSFLLQSTCKYSQLQRKNIQSVISLFFSSIRVYSNSKPPEIIWVNV